MTHSQNMSERSLGSNLHFGERVAKDLRKTCCRQKTKDVLIFQMSSLFVTPHTNCIKLHHLSQPNLINCRLSARSSFSTFGY